MDKRNNNSIIDCNFKQAVEDYSFLIEKRYTVKSLLKLVGDRYNLNRQQRDVIYRSISNKDDSLKRKLKKVSALNSKDELFIDFYNIFFTILNYLNGKVLFLCTDSFLRDNGGIFGKISLESHQYQKIISLIINYLKDLEILKVYFLLDSPVSKSGELASFINEHTKNLALNAFAYTTRSPDYELKKIDNGVISTSDSIIIANSETGVYDLSFNILKEKYDPTFLDINIFLN